MYTQFKTVQILHQKYFIVFWHNPSKEFQVLKSTTDAFFHCHVCLCLNYLLHQSVSRGHWCYCPLLHFSAWNVFTQLKLPKSLQGSDLVGSFRTVSGPILKEYWTSSKAIWLVDFSYWPSECINLVIKLWNSYFCDSVSGWSCTEKDNFQLIRNLIFYCLFLLCPRFQRGMFGC